MSAERARQFGRKASAHIIDRLQLVLRFPVQVRVADIDERVDGGTGDVGANGLGGSGSWPAPSGEVLCTPTEGAVVLTVEEPHATTANEATATTTSTAALARPW